MGGPTLRRRLVLLIALAATSACAGRKTGSEARVDRNVIYQEQLLKHRFDNAHEAVQALAGDRTRGVILITTHS
jgi:hypothetical protein